MSLVFPVIVIPGITATNLKDEYPLPYETVWSVIRNWYERITLHPDSLNLDKVCYEAIEPSRVVSDQVFEVAYKELVEELRNDLSESKDIPVPVYTFGYDWRQPLSIIEEQLSLFIDEVIERTKLLRHYHKEGYGNQPKVNLIGHSMGGLVITGYLQRRPDANKVHKVATLATPYRGSFEAVIKVATGTANLGASPPSSSEREAARVTPSLYHLIPSCNGLWLDQGLEGDLFEAQNWQRTVMETLERFVETHAVNPHGAHQQAASLFSNLLSWAKAHRERIESFKLEQTNIKPEDWLCVIGVDTETRVEMKIKMALNGPEFDLSSEGRKNDWKSGRTAYEKRQTGDGTVPFEAALPPFLSLENVVCITPDDFGYWEVQDRVLAKAAGFHGILPNMDMLHRLVVRHLTGRPDAYNNTWGRPAPGITEGQWKPPLELRAKID